MKDDDLRFGDRDGKSGSRDLVGSMDTAIQVTIQLIIFVVVLYVLYGVVDNMIFNGALPF